MYPWNILKTYLCLCYPYDIQEKTYDSEDNLYVSIWADDLSHWEDSNFAGSCSLKKDNLMKLMNAKCLYSPPIPFEDDEKKWYAQRTDLFHTLPPLLPLLLKKVNFLKVTNDVRIGSLIGVIQQDFA